MFINIYTLVVARSGSSRAQAPCNIHPRLCQIGARAACAMPPVQWFIRMFRPRLPLDEVELMRAVGYTEPDVWQRPFCVSDTCTWHGCGCRGRRGADDMHCELCNNRLCCMKFLQWHAREACCWRGGARAQPDDIAIPLGLQIRPECPRA